MGSTLIVIGVAVNQNRENISDFNNNNKKKGGQSGKDIFNQDLLLESPTVKYKSPQKINLNLLNNKSAKIGKIAKFREKDKEEQQQQPVLYSMVSQL